MKTRFLMSVILLGGVMGAAALGSTEARAQASGRIYLTSEQVPADAKGKALRKLLKKTRVSTIKKSDGGDSWTAYGFAKLRYRPSTKLMKLALNDGKLHVVVRKRVGRRWVRVKVGSVDYSKRTRLVRFELSISDGNGIPASKKHKLELVVQNRRKRDITLAKTTFQIK